MAKPDLHFYSLLFLVILTGLSKRIVADETSCVKRTALAPIATGDFYTSQYLDGVARRVLKDFQIGDCRVQVIRAKNLWGFLCNREHGS